MEQIGLFLNVSRETSDEDLITLVKRADISKSSAKPFLVTEWNIKASSTKWSVFV